MTSNSTIRLSEMKSVYVLRWMFLSLHLCSYGSPVDGCSLYKPCLGDRLDIHTLNCRIRCPSFRIAAGVSVVKQPVGLVCRHGKSLDGLILIPFEGGRSLT